MKIKLPYICYLDGKFYIITTETVSRYKIKNNVLLHPENLVRKIKSGWLLDSDGFFYELKAIGKKREWMRVIPLWNFVMSEYKMTEPKKVTILEMKEKMQKIPKRTPYKDLKEDFIRHLNSYEDDRILDKKVLDEWPL